MQLIEQIYPDQHSQDFKTQYIKYRVGRLKHQYWLWNRKRDHKQVDWYDALILKNCQPGRTAFFSSAGYYLQEIWPEIDSIEMHPVTTKFCPSCILVHSRNNLYSQLGCRYDNFAVVNNRADHWVSVAGLTAHLINYADILNTGARVFYSFRDTQIIFNRLTVDHQQYFLDWAHSLTKHGFKLVWHDTQFAVKQKDHNGCYDGLENPDTTNGNLKFWFVYKGTPWTVTT
jgi:hypothetical protein